LHNLVWTSNLKIKSLCMSDTLTYLFWATRSYISEDKTLHSDLRENLKLSRTALPTKSTNALKFWS
jgi:hypothetical protein